MKRFTYGRSENKIKPPKNDTVTKYLGISLTNNGLF